MVKTKDGNVAVVYYQPIPKLVKIGEIDLYFTPQFGVSMAFAPEEAVPPLLAFRGGCCGSSRQVIFLANEAQYKHWQDGNGGR